MSRGTQFRDFCAVGDIAEAICIFLECSEKPGRNVFNVGSGRALPLRSIVESVRDELNLNVDINFSKPFHPYEPMHLVPDISRARQVGWKPKTNLAYAVWQLAKSQFPKLDIREPAQFF